MKKPSLQIFSSLVVFIFFQSVAMEQVSEVDSKKEYIHFIRKDLFELQNIKLDDSSYSITGDVDVDRTRITVSIEADLSTNDRFKKLSSNTTISSWLTWCHSLGPIWSLFSLVSEPKAKTGSLCMWLFSAVTMGHYWWNKKSINNFYKELAKEQWYTKKSAQNNNNIWHPKRKIYKTFTLNFENNSEENRHSFFPFARSEDDVKLYESKPEYIKMSMYEPHIPYRYKPEACARVAINKAKQFLTYSNLRDIVPSP